MAINNQLNWRCNYCHKSRLIVESNAVACLHCQHKYVFKNGIWECEANFTPNSFSEERSQHLQDIENDHFWFKARDKLLYKKLNSLKQPNEESLLELGCGSGRVLASTHQLFDLSAGIEGHHSAINKAAEVCCNSHLLHCNVLNSSLACEQFDWVVAFDVLEHVDPIALLNEAFRLTKPGGRLLISVPAFPMLWSYVDDAAGHRCRYRLKQLKAELNKTGWSLKGHTYFQFLLFPLLALNRIINRKKQSQLERKPPHLINFILSAINHLEVFLFQRVSLPFGSSLIIWADKKTF